MEYDKRKADAAIQEILKRTARKIGISESELRRKVKRVQAAEKPKAQP